MPEDICGAETADGTPCQHPATNDNSCWIDSHGGDTAVGRDFRIGPDDHEDILQAAREGMSKAGCARAAGVSKQNLQRYLDADENTEFRDAFLRARHVGERKLIRAPLQNDPADPVEIDGQHARFLLSTSFDYVKTERRELEGDIDLGSVTVDFEDTDT